MLQTGYPQLDRGSRAQQTMARLTGNVRSYQPVAAKAERQTARLRQRQVYYANLEKDAGEAGLRQSEREAWLQRQAHARRRLAEIAYWLNELDFLFFALLGIRESQLARRTVWSNRIGRDHSRNPIPNGRRRSRWPIN